MQRSPSCEANRFSASPEIVHILWEPEDSLPHSQVLANCPYILFNITYLTYIT